MRHGLCLALLQRTMVAVECHVPVDVRKAAARSVEKTGRDRYRFQVGEWTWCGKACCKTDAKAQAWEDLLHERYL